MSREFSNVVPFEDCLDPCSEQLSSLWNYCYLEVDWMLNVKAEISIVRMIEISV